MFDFQQAGVTAHKLSFTIADMGLTPQSTKAEILKALGVISEGDASSRYDRNNAMLVFIGVPGINRSGAIYLITKRDGGIYLLDFPNTDDGHLTRGECERIFAHFHLAELAYRPNLVLAPHHHARA